MAIFLAILSVACAMYGTTIMLVGSGTWFFAFWYVLAAALLGAAGAVHAGWWTALPLLVKRIAAVTGCVALAGFLAAQAFIFKDFADAGEEELDYLIVLGAQVRDDGPSNVLRYRLKTARDYLQRNEGTRCIVSGGKGANEPVAEADAMADYLIEHGIDESRIIREDRSRNTRQNIEYSKEFLDSATDTVGIVTNNFHVARGTAIARADGLRHVCGIAAPSEVYFLPNNLARESLSVAHDFLAGELC